MKVEEIQALHSDDLIFIPAWLLSFLTLDVLFTSWKLLYLFIGAKGIKIETTQEHMVSS